jgi:hypothetical protein
MLFPQEIAWKDACTIPTGMAESKVEGFGRFPAATSHDENTDGGTNAHAPEKGLLGICLIEEYACAC